MVHAQHRKLHAVNRLTPRDTYLRNRCVHHYQRILPYPLKDHTNLKSLVCIASVYTAEIPFLLPKIPLLSHLAYFGQLYFNLTKNIPALNQLKAHLTGTRPTKSHDFI